MHNDFSKTEEVTEYNKIFRALMHFPGSTFTDLWDKSVESNKFTYYLKKMEEEELIQKKKGLYFLTLKGKAESATVSGETGKNNKRPYVSLLLVPRRDGKYILYHRMKEPYYGCWGLPGAKLEHGEGILEGAERELKEEMGLEGEGKVVGIQNIVTTNDGIVFGHMTQFIVLFDEPKGKLTGNNREGTYEWAEKEKIYTQKDLFPDVPGVIKDIERNVFCVKEVQVLQEKEKFAGINVTKIFETKLI